MKLYVGHSDANELYLIVHTGYQLYDSVVHKYGAFGTS